jgi:hypothetical protein
MPRGLHTSFAKVMIAKLVNFLTVASTTNIGLRIIRCYDSEVLNPQKFVVTEDLRPALLRWRSSQFEHIADPFLYADGDEIHCFFEVKNRRGPGCIEILTFNKQGEKYRRTCNIGLYSHISFPFLITDTDDDKLYMIPETGSEFEVAIYEPSDFPVSWRKKASLLRGNFVDSHILKHGELYYLFTTEKIKNEHLIDYQLNIYMSKSLFGGYEPHPLSPVKTGKKYSRSGGSIISDGGKLYRLAQDCATSYGRELHLFEVTELSPASYSEKIICENWIQSRMGHKLGGHHLSKTSWLGDQYIAVDFNYKDSYFQRFFYKLMSLRQRRKS